MIIRAEPPSGPLQGTLRPPGDKSISHRALILAGLAEGESAIRGLLRSEDTQATWHAMEQLGASISDSDGLVKIVGIGGTPMRKPDAPLDMGNSGTAMRLLAGVLAAQDFDSVLTGDASLNSRPMNRIIQPLEMMGARIEAQAGGRAPLRISGRRGLQGIAYQSPVASAQVKSCLLLAGLYAEGKTSVSEPGLSRDHTERMLPLFGVDIEGTSVTGGARLRAANLEVPADPSSAAFLAAAALLVPGSELKLEGVGVNPTRAAFFKVLQMMGADLEINQPHGESPGAEPVADIRVNYSGSLQGVDVPKGLIPAMIDEIPVLLAVASAAAGVTRVRGAAELRVKESDRLAVMGEGLQRLGVEVTECEDGIDISGSVSRSATVQACDDHRCAMSFLVLGQAAGPGLCVEGAEFIDTSYPGFAHQLRSVGGCLQVEGETGNG